MRYDLWEKKNGKSWAIGDHTRTWVLPSLSLSRLSFWASNKPIALFITKQYENLFQITSAHWKREQWACVNLNDFRFVFNLKWNKQWNKKKNIIKWNLKGERKTQNRMCGDSIILFSLLWSVFRDFWLHFLPCHSTHGSTVNYTIVYYAYYYRTLWCVHNIYGFTSQNR